MCTRFKNFSVLKLRDVNHTLGAFESNRLEKFSVEDLKQRAMQNTLVDIKLCIPGIITFLMQQRTNYKVYKILTSMLKFLSMC